MNKYCHERDILVWLNNISSDIYVLDFGKNRENMTMLTYVLVKVLKSKVEWLTKSMKRKENVFELKEWELFIKTREFNKLLEKVE